MLTTKVWLNHREIKRGTKYQFWYEAIVLQDSDNPSHGAGTIFQNY